MQLEHRLSALLPLHLHSRLNTLLQYIAQRQLQNEMKNIQVLEFSAAYIRYLTVGFYAWSGPTAGWEGMGVSGLKYLGGIITI